MKSTVNTFPIMLVIEDEKQSYIGDGKIDMDKAYSRKLQEYSRDNQSLVVESSFLEETTIQQAIKQYLIERRAQIKLDGLQGQNYNDFGNMAVVASTKEGGK